MWSAMGIVFGIGLGLMLVVLLFGGLFFTAAMIAVVFESHIEKVKKSWAAQRREAGNGHEGL